MGTTLQWGTPAAPSPPAGLDPANGLQPMVNALGANGGEIELASGNYFADPGSPSTPLDFTAVSNVTIRGKGQQNTKIKSPVLLASPWNALEDLAVMPVGTAYGVKIFKSGSFLARTSLTRVFIGASFEGAGDGPVLGLVLDGAGVLHAKQLTCAFCTSHGLLADSTVGGIPNTTLKFDMCSFVANAGYGIRILNSCGIAEFNGGNSEQNVLGELYAEEMNNLRCRDFDFETDEIMDNQVFVANSGPVVFDNCNFITASGKATRALELYGVRAGKVFANHITGYVSVGVIRAQENCSFIEIGPNDIPSGCWIEDYSR